jgi:1-acyl-sn-glycerol-3-phosphate acyltransferase
VLNNIKAISKIILFFIAVLCYLITTMPLLIYFQFNPWRARKILARILHHYAKLGLAIFDIRPQYQTLDRANQPALHVCNHLSYLDILIIAARAPVCFVTSQEIRETPFLGHLCILSGCLFVERRNKNSIHNEINEVSEGLRQGLSVCIFPEATSTNGQSVKRFKRPLFNSSLKEQCHLVLFCLNYTMVSGKLVDIDERDNLFWYGDMSFLPHLWRLSQQHDIEVELAQLMRFYPNQILQNTTLFETFPKDFENDAASRLAWFTHQKISQHYVPIG